MNIKAFFLSSIPVLFALAVMYPAVTHAATPTFEATETAANAAPGTNDQTDVTSPTQANVPEVKASRTFTVASVPVASSTLVIGSGATSCTITFGVGTQDTDCSGGGTAAALVNTNTDATAAAVAARILSITGITVLNHGAVTLTSTTSTNVIVTTTGTETSATQITATDNAAITTTQNITGVIPVAQINTVTVAGTVETGDIFTVTLPTVGAVSYTVISSDTTTSKIANGVRTAVLASTGYGSQAFTAATSTNTVIFTAKVAGTGFTQTSSTTNYPGVAQQATFTPGGDFDSSYSFDIQINSTHYTATGASVSDVLSKLNTLLASDTSVTCSNSGSAIACTSNAAGTTFVYASLTFRNQGHNGGGGNSGGGSSGSSSGGSSSSSSDAALQAMIDSLKVKLAAIIAQRGGTAVTVPTSFTRDLDIGATGSHVMALQVWLNHHGFMVAASGAGSLGLETSTFGGLTQAALAKWQASVGITPAAGYFGLKTRAYLAAHP